MLKLQGVALNRGLTVGNFHGSNTTDTLHGALILLNIRTIPKVKIHNYDPSNVALQLDSSRIR